MAAELHGVAEDTATENGSLIGAGPFSVYLSTEAQAAGLPLRLPKSGDAGIDLPLLETTTIAPRGFSLLRTGVHLAIPLGWVGLIRDRSGLALRGAATTAGVIDASYRGEIKVAMHNLAAEPLELLAGERIAQCVVVPHFVPTEWRFAESVEELGATARGASGFGSSGR